MKIKRKILKFIVLTLSVLVMTLIFTVPTSAETNLSANTIYQNGTTTVTADVPSNTASITWRCVPGGIVSFGTATRSGNTYTVIATGAKLGTATISAIATDSSGNKTTITIGTIYVVLEDGVYTVRNNYTDQYFTGGTYYLRSQTRPLLRF